MRRSCKHLELGIDFEQELLYSGLNQIYIS